MALTYQPASAPQQLDSDSTDQHRPGLSIVVPALNEAGNILRLIERIDRALAPLGVAYEVVVVDDHSTDGTGDLVRQASAHYPVSLICKRGRRGKAQSLLEGFAQARYDLVALIDADLQYPPEALPEMIAIVCQGSADVVVAERIDLRPSPIRRLLSRSFSFIFVRLLHGMKCDAQSGLKLFRREVLDHIELGEPSPWSFDLDFLVGARAAGYQTAQTAVVFEERLSGESKVGLLSTSWEIGLAAVQLKLRRAPVIHFRGAQGRIEGAGFRHRGRDYIHHSSVPPRESAFRRLAGWQSVTLFGLVALLCFACWLNWRLTIMSAVSVITALYFVDLGFSLFLIYQAFAHSSVLTPSLTGTSSAREWPIYTILCPLYRESAVLPQFVTAIDRLDYPRDRLQVLLLLEEDDRATFEAARAMDLPDCYEIILVPQSSPKTKPKACNYGLQKARGEYVVIYDAEDVPEPEQLKKAALAFEEAPPDLACIQAKLNFYNPNQNLLTRLFTAEYCLWFDLILPGLQACNCPIPLGGTSNHFKRTTLVSLGGWDAFNVTEDCDLGVRLSKRGLRTAMLDSPTLEEANSSLRNWLPQRTRWIKGYIQTYFVHMRKPAAFGSRGWLEPRLWGFQLVVAGKVFSMLVNPLMWLLTLTYFAFRPIAGAAIEAFFPGPVLYVGAVCLLFGNFLHLYYYMVGCAKRNQYDLIKYVFAGPAYWIGISVAAWIAVYKFIRQPHYWAKTSHGLHLGNRAGLAEAERTVGLLIDGAYARAEYVKAEDRDEPRYAGQSARVREDVVPVDSGPSPLYREQPNSSSSDQAS